MARLRRTVSAEDAKVLAEFVSVLVGGQSSRSQMVSELDDLLKDQTESFVAWVEERKSAILSRRPPGSFRPPSRGRLRTEQATARAPPATADGVGPPGQFVVVTDRFVLKPNAETGGDGGLSAPPGVWPEVSAVERRKLELAAEMTRKLREILGRLSDKGLDESAREKYQELAQSIQRKLATLTAPPRPPRS